MAAKQDDRVNCIRSGFRGSRFGVLAKLNKDLTVILVSHNMQYVSQSVNKVLCVNKTIVIHPTNELSEKEACDMPDMHLIRHDMSVTC